MPEAFVQVGMQVVAGILVTVEQPERFVVDDELLQETVTVRRLVVSVCQVTDGHAFAAVFRPHPVGVGQVDADGRGRIEVASEDGRLDDLGRHPPAFRFLETVVHGRVVFKPLGVGAQFFRTRRGFQVLEVGVSFPTGFQSQRVAVGFRETVGEVHHRLGLLYPQDGVFVECLQVAGAVKFDEFVEHLGLFPVFCHVGGFFQPKDDAVDGCAVQASRFPYFFF